MIRRWFLIRRRQREHARCLENIARMERELGMGGACVATTLADVLKEFYLPGEDPWQAAAEREIEELKNRPRPSFVASIDQGVPVS